MLAPLSIDKVTLLTYVVDLTSLRLLICGGSNLLAQVPHIGGLIASGNHLSESMECATLAKKV